MKKFLSVEAPRALRAARALLADPNDLPQVFTLIEALSGDTLGRLERQLAKSAGGQWLLTTHSNIVDQLEDREALRRLPEGSLGRAYLAFVESEGISAKGIRDAELRGFNGTRELTPNRVYMSSRMRDTHDLWHAVTGYRGDVLGETALLAFSLAQTWNPGIAVILVVGILKSMKTSEARVLVLDGYRRGQRAAWLPGQVWEDLLAQPLRAVRAQLNLEAPPVYTPVRAVASKRAAMAPA